MDNQAPDITEQVSIKTNTDSTAPSPAHLELTRALKRLTSNLNEEQKTELQALLDDLLECDQETPKLKEKINSILKTLIKGNANQALMAGTLAFFIGFAGGVASSNTIGQTELSESFKSLLTGVAALSGGFGRLQLGIDVNKSGGSNFTIRLLCLSLMGIILTTSIAESSKLENINSITDYRAIILFSASLLSGFGLSAFSQVSNVLMWAKPHKKGRASAILGGVAGLAPGLFGLIRFALLEAFSNDLGQTLTSSLLISCLVSAVLTLKFSKNYSLVDSPYHQLKHGYHLSPAQAQLLAKHYGQTLFPDNSELGPWLSLATQLKNPKVLKLILNYMIAFGGFLGMTASLNLTLSSWGYSAKDALLITALFSFFSSLCRAAIASPVNCLDKDRLGGGLVNSSGSLLILLGSLLVAVPNQVPEFKTLILSLTLLAIGFGINSAATFKMVSSEIEKEQVHIAKTPIDNAKANALISCIGTFGSVIFTIGGGQLASQNSENPELGYVQIFYAFTGLSIIAGIPVAFMTYTNHSELHISATSNKPEILALTTENLRKFEALKAKSSQSSLSSKESAFFKPASKCSSQKIDLELADENLELTAIHEKTTSLGAV